MVRGLVLDKKRGNILKVVVFPFSRSHLWTLIYLKFKTHCLLDSNIADGQAQVCKSSLSWIQGII